MNNGGGVLKIMFVFCIIISLFFLFSTNIIDKALDVISIKKEVKNEISYFDLEIKMKNSAKKYIKNTYANIENNIEIPVKLETLIKNYYLAPIKDIYTEENIDILINKYSKYLNKSGAIKRDTKRWNKNNLLYRWFSRNSKK